MIRILCILCLCGLVASNNETSTIKTITTEIASTTLKIEEGVNESTSQTSSVKPPETTTLPSLPDEGKAKSRRKPGFRSEDETPSKVEEENVKDVPIENDEAKKIDVKKDGKTKSSKKKGAVKDKPHGKKEIRQEDEKSKEYDIKSLDSNKNMTSIDNKSIQKDPKITEKPWPSFDKKEINKTLSNNHEDKVEVETTSTPKSTTEAPFKMGSSIVKIVPLKQDSKPVSSTTTAKSTLQNVEIPRPVSVGLDTSPSAISPLDTKFKESKVVNEQDDGSAGLIVGIFFGMILTSVLVFVGLKRVDAIRRRREYRRMNDFLIDGMYNDA